MAVPPPLKVIDDGNGSGALDWTPCRINQQEARLFRTFR
jgi:hypothetical protein